MSARIIPRQTNPIPVAASALLGLVVSGLGLRALVVGHLMPLFGGSLVVLGLIAVGLAFFAAQGRRAAWAYSVALWGVVGFCAFFSAPKVISLGTLKQVTPEMELALGRGPAEAAIDRENFQLRLTNLGVCTLFALPFAGVCFVLARGGRSLERRG